MRVATLHGVEALITSVRHLDQVADAMIEPHQLITYLTKQGIISPKLQLLSGHTTEQSSRSIEHSLCPMSPQNMK